jgi:hypothetical protein
MNQHNVHLLDLPNEILFLILRKLENVDVFYSLMDINNQRLDSIDISIKKKKTIKCFLHILKKIRYYFTMHQWFVYKDTIIILLELNRLFSFINQLFVFHTNFSRKTFFLHTKYIGIFLFYKDLSHYLDYLGKRGTFFYYHSIRNEHLIENDGQVFRNILFWYSSIRHMLPVDKYSDLL